MRVFYTSPWVPREWIQAHALEPRGVWYAPDFAFEPQPLTEGVCAFAQAVVHLAEKEPGSAVVFASHCDQLRRGFDAAGPAARLFLFNLPATWQTAAARRMYTTEVERLGRFLVSLGGRAPTKENLEAAIAQSRSARERLLAAAPKCSAREFAEAAARFHWDGEVQLPSHSPLEVRLSPGAATSANQASSEHPAAPARSKLAAPGDGRAPVPLALVGGPLPRAQWGLLEVIEAAGGRVALNATEAGERSLMTLNEATPLTENYLQACVDVWQRPNSRLYEWLKDRLAARKIRGIVLWHYVGCDLWRAEAQSLREAFGLPLLLLEATEAPNSPRVIGRIEAFLEALK